MSIVKTATYRGSSKDVVVYPDSTFGDIINEFYLNGRCAEPINCPCCGYFQRYTWHDHCDQTPGDIYKIVCNNKYLEWDSAWGEACDVNLTLNFADVEMSPAVAAVYITYSGVFRLRSFARASHTPEPKNMSCDLTVWAEQCHHNHLLAYPSNEYVQKFKWGIQFQERITIVVKDGRVYNRVARVHDASMVFAALVKLLNFNIANFLMDFMFAF